MYTYFAFGLVLSSETKLPELQPVISQNPDIFINKVFSPIPKTDKDYTITSDFSDDEIRFRWSGVGDYTISSGNSISYQPFDGCHEDLILLPLQGFVMAALLAQRGLLVLHGSCVSLNEKAVVVIGPKGFGKSSLTAALLENGCKFVSDDITAISLDTKLHVVPGIPVIKLWPESLIALGKKPDNFPRVNSLTSKRCYSVIDTSQIRSSPISLGGVILLFPTRSEFHFELLKLTDAVLSLLSNCYLSRFHSSLTPSLHRNHLYHCSLIAQKSLVKKLCFKHDLSKLQNTAELIADFISQI